MTETQTQEDFRRRLTRDELDATQEKVAKVNARAARRGFTGRLEVRWEEVTVERTTVSGLKTREIRFATEITGTAPKYNGWELLAVLDWHSTDGLITRVSPGVKLDGIIDRSALREGVCDHCETIRDRKDIYLVRGGASGYELRQVGKTCLKDFLGHDVSPVFLAAGGGDDDEYFEGGFGGGLPAYDPLTVLAASWAVIQVTGFRPASFENSTKSAVLSTLDPRTQAEREAARKIAPFVSQAHAQAEVIREYILGTFTGDSEYVVNLKAAVSSQYVTSRAFGLVVSAPQTWAKSVERDLARRAESNARLNEWVGAVKERLTLKLQVKSIRVIEGDYGTSHLYVLADDAGHTYKWFSSSKALGSDTDGTWFTLKATVKAHTEYEGAKTTQLTRGTVLAQEKAI